MSSADKIEKNLKGISHALEMFKKEGMVAFEDETETARGGRKVRDIELYSEKYSQVRSVDALTNEESELVFMDYQVDGLASPKPEELLEENFGRSTSEFGRAENEDHNKVSFADFLPLTFLAANNGLNTAQLNHDNSLSCFSMEEVDIKLILNWKNKDNQLKPQHSAALSQVSDNDLGPDFQNHKHKSGLMSYSAVLQRNYKELVTSLVTLGQQILPAFEKFEWLFRQKRQKYRENVPLTLEEKMRGFDAGRDLVDTLRKNQLLNSNRFLDQTGDKKKQEFYSAPQFLIPTEAAIKGTSNGIPIDYEYVHLLQAKLSQARDRCIETRYRDKNTFLSLLERMDRFFMESVTNINFQNKAVAIDNEELERRNKNLANAIRDQNLQITKAEKQRAENLTKLVTVDHQAEKQKQKNHTAAAEEIVKKKDRLAEKLEEEGINMIEAKRMDSHFRQTHVEFH